MSSAEPGSGVETAPALFGLGTGDCPKAEVVRKVTDVSATATEALMNARGSGTLRCLRKDQATGASHDLASYGAVGFDQQSVTDRARPASLVSLYLLFMSLAVSARAITVASKSTRCLDAISLLAIA